MIGFALLLGHLVGDYVVQNDWMAKYKTARLPREDQKPVKNVDDPDYWKALEDWDRAAWAADVAPLACTVHCFCYTLAVFLVLMPLTMLPFWFYLAVFLVHWPVDRWRLAKVWMEGVSSQKSFANGPLAPWSVIVVDNVFHLLTLYVLALYAGLR